ncbi:ATP phosphoribosyltransferase regulatory subunit, partial [Candidatus Woesearchaeota archaeon]|nr:ATP phosphoribosyltransferase regulatory subunit [Candidatus Woesearchaeota archaeon]
VGVNNRKFLLSLFVAQGIPEDKLESAMMSIDKLDKQSVDDIVKETNEKGIPEDAIRKLLDLLRYQGSNEEKLNFFASQLFVDDPGIVELRELLSYFANDTRVQFVPTLARGLGYYTGTVLEVYSQDKPEIGSVGGGGRYDDLIEGYLESAGQSTGDRSFPAIGISFGLDRIVDVLKQLGQAEMKKTNVQLFIAPISTQQESYAIAQEFRKAGIAVDMDLMKRGPSKNFAYADAYNIPFVAVIGENEINEGVITLKDMSTGNEEKISVADAIAKLQAYQA